MGLLLICGLIVRLWLPYDFFNAFDEQRELLSARHIAFFNDFPFTDGQPSGGILRYNAPESSYFLALLLRLFGDDMITIRIVNLLLQLGVCLMIYYAARTMFGKQSAFISLFLSLFLFASVNLSAIAGRKTFAVVFSTAFLLLALLGVTHRNRIYLVTSMVCFWIPNTA